MTPERLALLAQLEREDELRRAKARAATKAWKLRNPHRVNAPAKERRQQLKILQHEKALHDQSLDQIM